MIVGITVLTLLLIMIMGMGREVMVEAEEVVE